MSGLDLLRNIRAMSPHVPVVIVTAYAESTTYLNAIDGGAAGYLRKPLRREEILTVARKALARRGIRAPGASGKTSAEAGGTAA